MRGRGRLGRGRAGEGPRVRAEETLGPEVGVRVGSGVEARGAGAGAALRGGGRWAAARSEAPAEA